MSREEALAQLASESMFERIFPRAVTMFIPTAIGHALGWVEVGGAPMFLAIADADTLFFDIVLMVIGWSLWSNWRQGGHVRPSFPYFLLTSLPLAIALCYQTANFGTQFRLRSMVAIGLLLLPFASAPPRVAARQAAHE